MVNRQTGEGENSASRHEAERARSMGHDGLFRCGSNHGASNHVLNADVRAADFARRLHRPACGASGTLSANE